MTTELILLASSIGLGFLYMMASSFATTRERGTAWNVGARDEKMPELSAVPARLDRAFQNFKETFPFFAAAILLNELVSRTQSPSNTLSLIGAHLYFWCRVVYLPLYAFGIPVIRTLVWIGSALGIFLVVLAAFS